MGWGRAGRGSLHLRLPLSHFPYLHPSLSFSVHLSLCLLPPLAVNFPHPPHICLLLSGQGSRPLGFGTQVPLPEGGSQDPWTDQEDFQGAGGGTKGLALARCQRGPMSHSCPQSCSSFCHHLRLPLTSLLPGSGPKEALGRS